MADPDVAATPVADVVVVVEVVVEVVLKVVVVVAQCRFLTKING